MIYFGSFFAGIINGLFASGAGQILVFIFVFILKKDSHKARATSICLVGIITIITLVRYMQHITVDYKNMIAVAIIGIVCGVIGTKFMKKINSVYLNLASGILVAALSAFNLFG